MVSPVRVLRGLLSGHRVQMGALALGGAMALLAPSAWAYEDCGGGYYCDGDLVCNASNTGCLPAGATECSGGGYCDAGTTCCSDGTCSSGSCGSGSGSGSSGSGSGSCPYTNDGECDEGSYCDYGTDTADCSGGGSTPPTGGDGWTCASESLYYEGDACGVDFCIHSDTYACYYEVNGTTVDCGNCSTNDISSCAEEAASICVEGGSSTSEGSSGDNSCTWAYDGECDEGSYCDYGTDTSDCEGGGCAMAGSPGGPRGSHGWFAISALAFVAAGLGARRARRTPA